MLKKVSSKSRIAIALLICSSVLTAAIIQNAFGIDLHFDYFFVHEGPVENLEKDKYENRISEDEAYASAWIYGYRVDENGDVLGSVECNVGASQYNNQDGVNVVQFYAYADSRLLDWDLKGTANAWVKLPNRVRAGPGRDVDIGNGHPSHYLRTEDSYIVNTNQVRGRRIEASAKLRVKKATVRVQVTAVRA